MQQSGIPRDEVVKIIETRINALWNSHVVPIGQGFQDVIATGPQGLQSVPILFVCLFQIEAIKRCMLEEYQTSMGVRAGPAITEVIDAIYEIALKCADSAEDDGTMIYNRQPE